MYKNLHTFKIHVNLVEALKTRYVLSKDDKVKEHLFQVKEENVDKVVITLRNPGADKSVMLQNIQTGWKRKIENEEFDADGVFFFEKPEKGNYHIVVTMNNGVKYSSYVICAHYVTKSNMPKPNVQVYDYWQIKLHIPWPFFSFPGHTISTAYILYKPKNDDGMWTKVPCQMNGSSSSLYPERMADVDPNTTYTVAYMYETKEGEISFPSETADFCMRDHLKRLELTDAAMVGKGQYAFALPHEMNTKHLQYFMTYKDSKMDHWNFVNSAQDGYKIVTKNRLHVEPHQDIHLRLYAMHYDRSEPYLIHETKAQHQMTQRVEFVDWNNGIVEFANSKWILRLYGDGNFERTEKNTYTPSTKGTFRLYPNEVRFEYSNGTVLERVEWRNNKLELVQAKLGGDAMDYTCTLKALVEPSTLYKGHKRASRWHNKSLPFTDVNIIYHVDTIVHKKLRSFL